MPTLPLTPERMLESLKRLDEAIGAPARLVIGGGAAMTLAYQFPLSTQDVDAFSARGGLSLADLDRSARDVAAALGTAPDWLNSHFYTFTYVLPDDYATRLRTVFEGKHLKVDALGPEDLLIMKCFAGREKDRPHATKLARLANLNVVERHLAALVQQRIPGSEKAADFFDDLRDELDL